MCSCHLRSGCPAGSTVTFIAFRGSFMLVDFTFFSSHLEPERRGHITTLSLTSDFPPTAALKSKKICNPQNSSFYVAGTLPEHGFEPADM